MHHHNPCKYRHPLIRFIMLILSPKELCRYYKDGADICNECNSHIVLPNMYFTPFLSLLYILAGGAFGIIVPEFLNIKVFDSIPALFLMVFFHHIISAFVLSFFPWEAHDPKSYSIDSAYEDARNNLGQKFECIVISYLIVNILVKLM